MPKRKKVADATHDTDEANEEQSRIKHTVMLNSSFFRWIQDQHANHCTEFWRNGLEDYLRYGKEIQAKYPVASDTQSTVPLTAGVGNTRQETTLKAQKPNATLPFSQTASASAASGPAANHTATNSLFASDNNPASYLANASWGAVASNAAISVSQPGQSISLAPAASSQQHFGGNKHQPSKSFSKPDVGNTKPTTASEPAGTSASSSALFPPFSSPAISAPATSAPAMPPFSFGSSQPAFSFGSSTPSAALGMPPAASSSQTASAGLGQPFPTAASSGPSASQPAGSTSLLSPALGLPQASFSGAEFGSPLQTFETQSAAKPSGSASLLGSSLRPPDTQPAAKPAGTAAAAAAAAGTGTSGAPSSAAPATANAASTAASPRSLFSFGSSQPAFGSSNFAFGASQAASGSSAPASSSSQPFAFGSSQPSAFGSSQPAFGSSQPAFSSSQPFAFGGSSPASGSSSPTFGSSLPAFGSPLAAASASQPGTSGALAPCSFGASQPASSAASQPSMFGSGSASGALPTFSWGAPPSSSAAVSGSASASGLFSFSLPPGQNGAGPSFGAPAAQANGAADGEEQAEPEEAVVYEKTEGVLESQEVKWAYLKQGKWGKFRQGKVLVCQPSGTSKPYLQFQTSGYVVGTAHAQTKLTQHSADAKRVLGTLAMSMRQVDKESGAESFDEPESQMTMIVCKSSDAAKKIVDKMPDPQK